MPSFGGQGRPSQKIKKSSGNSSLRTMVVLVVLSAVMVTFSAPEGGSGPFSVARGVFQTVTMPVRYVGVAIVSPLQGLGNVFENLTADQETLSELQDENEQLKARNAELEEAEQTATRLEQLLSLQSTYNLQSTAARVISGSSDSWTSTITINKGSTSGLEVGMPVTGSSGVIGQIVECGPATATVQLITDENSGVSAMVQETRAQGMLRGSASGTVRLDLIRTDQEVEVGNTVVTSGLGGIYPKGLPIGTVTNVEKPSGAQYYDIIVTPLTSAEVYNEVLVITSLTEDQMATSDDIEEADSQEAVVTNVTEESSSAEESGGESGDGSTSGGTDSEEGA